MSILPPTSPKQDSALTTSANDTFQTDSEFVRRLHALRQSRRKIKIELRGGLVRESLSASERAVVLAKTGGQCHLCGGPIEDSKWKADHVFSHALGAKHSPDNYLPAHSLCNGYRWFYKPEEFQWILKLGVWLRTQIETETKLGKETAKAFRKYDCVRAARRKNPNTRPKARAAGTR
jgi:5-methylcytosine-specific restriction endonuclease McrA